MSSSTEPFWPTIVIERLSPDHYVAHSEANLKQVFADWYSKKGFNKPIQDVLQNVNLRLINGEVENTAFPGVFHFQVASPHHDYKDFVAFRLSDEIPREKFVRYWHIPNLPVSLLGCDHLGSSIYVVYDQRGVEAAYYHYLAHVSCCSCHLDEVKVDSFPALVTFRHEGEHVDMEWSAVALPKSFNGTVDQLAKQVIAAAR